MPLNNLAKSVVFALLLSFSASAQNLIDSGADRKSSASELSKAAIYSLNRNERFFIRALGTLSGAQATYQATTGNGNFGSLAQLAHAGLINEALASGSIYGYNYSVAVRNYAPPNLLPSFELVAVPRLYRKTGVRSFFMETNGVIKGDDKRGAAANRNDPVIEEVYTCYSLSECEAGAISSLRILYGAQATYQATSGFGNFGSLCQLGGENLIDQILAQGTKFGYYFVILKRDIAQQRPASLEIRAIPQNYPTTGLRSFIVATDGVIRGADRAGAPVNSDALPIEF
jgi:hypothetical protein